MSSQCCFSTVKKKKYNRCQNYMYVIYSMYMTYRVTKIKMQNMVMQKLFSNNCCSIISAQLCLFCLFCLRSWEENGSFWIKSECHPVIWSESICPQPYDRCCVSHTFCFQQRASLSAASRYLQLSPETIQRTCWTERNRQSHRLSPWQQRSDAADSLSNKTINGFNHLLVYLLWSSSC